MIIGKAIDYDLFPLCKQVYPYLEDDSLAAERCKNAVRQWLQTFLTRIGEIGLHNIYKIGYSEKISIEDVVNDEFLFYSYMEGMLPTAYIIIAGENPCSNLDEWLHKRQDGVLLKNDPDGIGLDISADEELMKQIDTLGIQMWSAGSVFTWKDT